jgi:hypothetical protein
MLSQFSRSRSRLTCTSLVSRTQKESLSGTLWMLLRTPSIGRGTRARSASLMPSQCRYGRAIRCDPLCSDVAAPPLHSRPFCPGAPSAQAPLSSGRCSLVIAPPCTRGRGSPCLLVRSLARRSIQPISTFACRGACDRMWALPHSARRRPSSSRPIAPRRAQKYWYWSATSSSESPAAASVVRVTLTPIFRRCLVRSATSAS